MISDPLAIRVPFIAVPSGTCADVIGNVVLVLVGLDVSISAVDKRLVVVTSISGDTCLVVTGAAGGAFDPECCDTPAIGLEPVFLADSGSSSNAFFAFFPPHRLANNPAIPLLLEVSWCPVPPPFFFLEDGILFDDSPEPVPDDLSVELPFLLLFWFVCDGVGVLLVDSGMIGDCVDSETGTSDATLCRPVALCGV